MNVNPTLSAIERDLHIARLAAHYRKRIKALHLSNVDDPIDLLDPRILADFLRLEYVETEEIAMEIHDLGSRRARKTTRYAGYLDRRSNSIVVSLDFEPEQIRFTAAHELGHWLLHHGLEYHRERPTKNVTAPARRPNVEYEADRFATEWLMPPQWVRTRLQETYGLPLPIQVDYNLAWRLYGEEYERLMYADDLAQAKAVASRTPSFSYSQCPSMKYQFKVSTLAMALRLMELKLVVRA